MVRLRPRERKVHSRFTTPEIEKMEKLYEESGEQSLDQDFCKRLAKQFSCSQGRGGKPTVKWAEVQSWFRNRHQSDQSDNTLSANDQEQLVDDKIGSIKDDKSRKVSKVPEAGEKVPDLSELEFEARSSKDKAWYDVETFLSHRFIHPDEAEVLVRFVGFGADDDEWVVVKKDIRERSIPLDHSECGKVQAGDLVVCFQEREDQARYYDAHVVDIRRRMHDIRGCRCLFTIRYDHDSTEERVTLRRLCCRPTY